MNYAPSPFVRPEGIFQWRGWGVYFETPQRKEFYAPPSFCMPPAPRRVFSGVGGGGNLVPQILLKQKKRSHEWCFQSVFCRVVCSEGGQDPRGWLNENELFHNMGFFRHFVLPLPERYLCCKPRSGIWRTLSGQPLVEGIPKRDS